MRCSIVWDLGSDVIHLIKCVMGMSCVFSLIQAGDTTWKSQSKQTMRYLCLLIPHDVFLLYVSTRTQAEFRINT